MKLVRFPTGPKNEIWTVEKSGFQPDTFNHPLQNRKVRFPTGYIQPSLAE